jgi:hypothetical protein
MTKRPASSRRKGAAPRLTDSEAARAHWVLAAVNVHENGEFELGAAMMVPCHKDSPPVPVIGSRSAH